jgi:hypothetical protein
MLCGAGKNELCVVEYVFCANGDAEKRWDADPGSPIPGPSDGSGTWSYSGNTLTISTAAPGGFGTTTTVETYGVAFTYDDGGTRKLDWYSVAQTTPGDGSTIVGSYASQGTTTLNIPGGIIDLDSVVTREMTVAAGDPASWAQEAVTDITCTGLGCGSVPPGGTVNTDGTIAMPGQLYQVGSGYILQVDDALVLERQE